MTVDLLGHRGASDLAPENTLAAFHLALSGPDAADGVELDVGLTSDATPVVFHDDDLTRLTGQPGELEAIPWADLSRRRVRGHRIPSLDDTVDALIAAAAGRSRTVINVELKPTARHALIVSRSAEAIDRLIAAPGVEAVVSSFDPRVLYAAAAHPWRRAFLYDDLAALIALPALAAAGPIDLHPRHDLLTAAHVEEYAVPGRQFRTWTVDDASVAARLAAVGATAVITNRPAALRRELASLAGTS